MGERSRVMKDLNRRQFIVKSGKTAALTAGGLSLTSALPSRVLGANDRLRIALVGCGGRGRLDARCAVVNGAEIAWLCDLRDDRLADAAKFLAEVQDRPIKQTKSMAEVYADKDVDAVIIATPDHWHAPASILACQAGKDVYVEKPQSHNLFEGRQMIKAARKYGCVVQVGTQNRSGAYNADASQYIASGQLGKIPLVKVYNLKPGNPFNLGETGPKPANFDWDRWLGAAPVHPYHDNLFKGGWHHFWDFSGGDLANDGIHQMDLALMLLGDPGMPNSVSVSGGRLAHKGDDSEVPDLMIATYEFDDFVLVVEHSNYPRYMRKTTGTIRRNDEFPYWTQNSTRIELYGSELMMTVGRHGGGWQVVTSGGHKVEEHYGRTCDDEHMLDFFDAIKTRNRAKGDVETLEPAAGLVHLANISYQTGKRKLWYDNKNTAFINDPQANKLVKRTYRPKYAVPEKV